jgi:hypothetical protein
MTTNQTTKNTNFEANAKLHEQELAILEHFPSANSDVLAQR